MTAPSSSKQPFRLQHGALGMSVEESYTFVEHDRLMNAHALQVQDRTFFVGGGFAWKRFRGVVLLMALAMTILIVRGGMMQVLEGDRYQHLAESNRLRVTPVWPRRGLITDRRGVVLAENHSRFIVTVTPSRLPRDPRRLEEIRSTLLSTIHVSDADWVSVTQATSTQETDEGVLVEKLPYEYAMALAVKLPELPGIDLQTKDERAYPFSKELQSLSHVLGYVGKISQEEYVSRALAGYRRLDEIGKVGIEKSYESLLRGTLGERRTEVDARGREQGIVQEELPVNGVNIALDLDLELQRTAEEELSRIMTIANVKRGSVVAMDPRDGSLLAVVSLPAYNNNDFSGGVSSTVYQALSENPNHPLFPRAWAGTYPSGSTIKIVYALAGLVEKIIDEHTSFVSTGGIQLGPWFFPDWKAGGHGVTDVRKAIAWSVNTFFYTLGGGYGSFQGLGIERMDEWLSRVGLGQKTGIDVPGEGVGFVPTPEWKKRTQNEEWYIGDTYNVSIGQGDLLVTPLQVARYTAIIANGGYTITPHLARDAHLQDPHRIAPKEDVAIVQRGMRDNVEYGSGRALKTLPFPASGKTGTAQWNKEKRTHAWFTSYAPSTDPEIVVTVMLEEGGEGSSVSVPVAKAILLKWWQLRTARESRF